MSSPRLREKSHDSAELPKPQPQNAPENHSATPAVQTGPAQGDMYRLQFLRESMYRLFSCPKKHSAQKTQKRRNGAEDEYRCSVM